MGLRLPAGYEKAEKFLNDVQRKYNAYIGNKICIALSKIALWSYVVLYLLTSWNVMEKPFELGILLYVSFTFLGITQFFMLDSEVRFMRVIFGIAIVGLCLYFSVAYFALVPAVPFSFLWVIGGILLIELVFGSLGI